MILFQPRLILAAWGWGDAQVTSDPTLDEDLGLGVIDLCEKSDDETFTFVRFPQIIRNQTHSNLLLQIP